MNMHDAPLYLATASLIFLLAVVILDWLDIPPFDSGDNHDERAG